MVGLEHRLRTRFPSPSKHALPILVWITDGRDHDDRGRYRWTPFRNPSIALALRRFRCLRLDVSILPESEGKVRYAAEVGYRWYDPSGRVIGEPVSGKQIGSVARFSRRLKQTWTASFVTPLRTWSSGMRRIYQRSSRLEFQENLVEWKILREETAEHVEPARLARLMRRLEEVRVGRARCLQDEAAWMRTCRPRSRFLPPPKRCPETPTLR